MGAVVLITGASSGIGAATVVAFAKRGANLELGARRMDRLGRLHQMPEEKIDELIATNLQGVIATTQAALPWMLERRGGVIINVASVVAFRASPYSAVYSATKHAGDGLSHALRGELPGSGVKVCVVYPGVTGGTEFFSATERPVGPRYPATWGRQPDRPHRAVSTPGCDGGADPGGPPRRAGFRRPDGPRARRGKTDGFARAKGCGLNRRSVISARPPTASRAVWRS
jgi:short-subunit dehydrogenase